MAFMPLVLATVPVTAVASTGQPMAASSAGAWAALAILLASALTAWLLCGGYLVLENTGNWNT
jgi:hypothetical protein